ncbi:MULTISPECIES: S8 family serine peptidase [unclassified Clostridium]|uniref:S8 family serine peptidase n=1 Tax=unclassified Clostridium TaxID=2614128 RepID=UPI000297569A|nr:MULTISPECIES: S8 family serine peptidase [unclassified Clostridium]EKQ55870.1 MAG: subtilisin-like serine protease [Clostridium sp. Maddingley MBC34-26]
MFSYNRKLDYNLKHYISKNAYKNYRVLIQYKDFQSSIVRKISSYKGNVHHIIESANLISANLNSRGIDRISEYPEVKKIYLDEYLFLCGMSVTTANKVHFSEKFSLSGAGIGIGLVDSGVFPHQDLTSPSTKIELFEDLINDFHYPYDDNGHGTSIAGILCSSGLSSNNMYKGICSKSKLFCYKAFDMLGKGFASDVLYSIESLSNIAKENNIKILCLPFELLTHNTFIVSCFELVFDYAISKGLIPIVPSGSSLSGKSSIMGIATLSNCITVAGLNTATPVIKPYIYSSEGPYGKLSKPDLCAACVNVVSLNSDNNYISEKNGIKLYPSKLEVPYKTFAGTSIATAYISGLCALLCEKNPSITFKDIISLLKVACDPVEDISKAIQGEGLVDILKIIT